MNVRELHLEARVKVLEAENRDLKECLSSGEALTKREQFAGMAMQGLIIGVHRASYDAYAGDAVVAANALLKALEGE